MHGDRENLDGLLKLLDEVGMGWLSNEIRQLRFDGNEPSVTPEDITKSRQEYNVKGGEFPFGEIELVPSGSAAKLTDRNCIELILARIEAIAGHLTQAKLDATELGIDRIQLGVESEHGDRPGDAVNLLKSIASSIRTGFLQ